MRQISFFNDFSKDKEIPKFKEKRPVKFSFASIFCGVGGSSCGYAFAGGRCVNGVEFDKRKAKFYEMNFGKVLNEDVRNIHVEDFNEEVDILDGSPPCYDFSNSNTVRERFTARNYGFCKQNSSMLFFEFIRLINEIRPKFFVIENVPGMLNSYSKNIFDNVILELEKTGYIFSFQELDLSHYGWCQSRKRIFFIGARKDIFNGSAVLLFPKKSKAFVRLRDVLDSVVDHSELPRFSRTVFKKAYEYLKGGEAYEFKIYRAAADDVVGTITAEGGSIPLIETRDALRGFSMSELRKLFYFPDDYILSNKYYTLLNQLGNSVPPLFTKKISEHLLTL